MVEIYWVCDLNHIWPHYTSVSYLWSWILYRTHLFMTVLRMTWVYLQKTWGLGTWDAADTMQVFSIVFYYFAATDSLWSGLLDPLPNVPPFLLSFLNCLLLFIHKLFPHVSPAVLFILRRFFYLTLSDLPARSSSSAYRSFHRCYEEFYSIEYFLCCILLFLCICIYISN